MFLGDVAYAGHYVTDIRSSSSTTGWVRYDDQWMDEIEWKKIKTESRKDAYLLFYSVQNITDTDSNAQTTK